MTEKQKEAYSIRTNFGIQIDKVECSEEEAIKQLKTIARRAKMTLYLFRLDKKEKRQVYITCFPN